MRVAELEAALEQHVRYIIDTATNTPPGGNFAWNQLLEYYHVAPASAADRVQEVASRGMTRGAAPSEVTRALAAVQAWAERELSATVPASGVVTDPALGALTVRLARLVPTETARYEGAVVPARSPSVGSIFANASATAGAAPWANVKVSAASVLVCLHCGAPQEASLDFLCRYCKQPMAGASGA